MNEIASRIDGVLGVSLYRNAGYLLLNSGALSVAGFAFWATAARIYPAEGLGLASAAISAMGLLALLATLGLDYGLIRFLPEADGHGRAMLNTSLTLGAIASLALAVVSLAGLRLWSPALAVVRQEPVFLVTFLIFAVASVIRTMGERVFIARRRAGLALCQGLIFSLVRFVPLVVLATRFRTFGIFAAWGIALGLAVIVSLGWLLPRTDRGYRPAPALGLRAMSGMLRFSFANCAATLFWAIPVLGLPILVLNVLGAEANAYFYIGWTTAYVLISVPITISLSLFAEGANRQHEMARNITRSLKVIALLVPAIVITLLIGDRVLALFGEAYSANATKLLWVLAASAIPVGFNQVYFTVKRVQKQMRNVIALNAFTAFATMALSYLLLPRMGIMGAGIGWLVPQTVVAVVSVGTLLRERGRSPAGDEMARDIAAPKGAANWRVIPRLR